MSRTIVITRGLPASGKSTWSKEQLHAEPGRWKRVNLDDVRSMLDDGLFTAAGEKLAKSIQEEIVRKSLKDGFDVIIDNTHLTYHSVKQLHKLAESIGDVKVIEKTFNTSIDECKLRNKKRSHPVPEHVIDNMALKARITHGCKLNDAETIYKPRWAPGGPGGDPKTMKQDESLPKAIIVDLDGTVALMNGRNPYDATDCDKDLPNTPVITCVRAMYDKGYKIIFMSGRQDKYREPTERFLTQHFQTLSNHVVLTSSAVETLTMPHELHMRATGDQRKDDIIKQELFDANVVNKYFIEFVLDDRNQVVDGWRQMGLTCFQVNYGDF